MTTIEKQQFKITIPTIISIILCTASTIMFLFGFFNKNTQDINSVKTEIQGLKNSQEIIVIQQKNGFQTINNARKRDSAYTVNGLKEIKEQLQEMRCVLLKNTSTNYYKSSLTNNE